VLPTLPFTGGGDVLKRYLKQSQKDVCLSVTWFGENLAHNHVQTFHTNFLFYRPIEKKENFTKSNMNLS
tara:strand:- start:327 stop:533 length:207 start_codon:yes stop_codon:yes gene_type:complete